MPAAAFAEFLDPHPAPGNLFGSQVVPLSTGNVVITSPNDDAGGTDAGAVYLFNGATGALISTLTGSHAFDHVGQSAVVALSNGNFLVPDPHWTNGTTANAGALTFGSGTTGVSGAVSAANSLVGSSPNDFVGLDVRKLGNGNFLVLSQAWANGAGAVTFGSGTTGVSGVVSAANSLVGSSASDRVGESGAVVALSTGNYLVFSPSWSGGAGAVTFGSGVSGVSGTVSAANSLVGSSPNDQVGRGGFAQLSNGNYLLTSFFWNNIAGAVTFGSGVSGVSGVVSAANSLVGYPAGYANGIHVTLLSNGNYVVSNPYWTDGTVANEGAATFGSGTSGVSGVVSAANSLVGSSPNDFVGGGDFGQGVTALSNGNYVVVSPGWANAAGAVTFGNGVSGVSGVVSAANSLVGSSASDEVGYGVTALSNGNYVVSSPYWSNGATASVGSVTFGSGTSGVSGVVSAANSLVGSSASDDIGTEVFALSNGNYVVSSPNWSNGEGAATFGSGTSGVSGVVSAANSLVGSSANDGVGARVFPLSNGNYLVQSPGWSNGPATHAGAVTFGSGTTGISGVVSPANSLVGSTTGDSVGNDPVTELKNGNYLVGSQYWTNGAAPYAGAVTFGNGTTGVSGVVGAANSLVGSTTGDMVGGFAEILLPNGNYLVRTPSWSHGAGAVTFGSGASGVSGVISAANSLVGSSAFDSVGGGAPVTVLSNGNYVVDSPNWSDGTSWSAVTFGSGTSGISGVVSASNSLVGMTYYHSVTALSNGNYVVDSPDWSNSAASQAGALTFGNGTSGVSGVVGTSNSLVGLSSHTDLQYFPVIDNVNGNYYGLFPSEGGGRVRVASQADGRTAPAHTTTTVTSSGTPSVVGQAVTFTATVGVVAPGTGQPAGTVTFMDGNTVLGTGTVNGSGQATFTATGLSAGAHVITVIYSGNADLLASTSAAFTQTVVSAQQELSLVIAQVTDMMANGVLGSGNGNALIAKLNAAITSLNQGNTVAGVNQMSAFLNQAQAFLQSGRLDSTGEQVLVANIDLAIDAVLNSGP